MSTNKWARRRSRRALVQAVYQWQMADANTREIEEDFKGGNALDKADVPFFEELLRAVLLRTDELDEVLEPALDRKLTQLDPVETAVLRLAVCELMTRLDVPYPVVIDEYVELTKVFGAQDSHKFVNGVLDRLATSLRSAEVSARERI